MTNAVNILQMGFGPIGQKVTQLIYQRPCLQLKAIIDIHPQWQHRDAGSIMQQPELGVRISNDLTAALVQHSIDIAIVTTTSSIQALEKQIEPLIAAGIPVISSCEQLLYPWMSHNECATRLDRFAKRHNVGILGTGVNPGFLMDYLPVFASSIAEEITHVQVNRTQDATPRRLSFRKKIGVGLSVPAFHDAVDQGALGHVGLKESAYFIANALGWTLSQATQTTEPVITNNRVQGIKQVVTGRIHGDTVIELNFIAAMDQPQPEDRIIITGTPSYEMAITPPVNGDSATTAMLVNAIPAMLNCKPGLNPLTLTGFFQRIRHRDS